MKIYSEKTNKEYKSVDECLAAEAEFDAKLAAEKAKKEELAAARKERAGEVEKAYATMVEAQKTYSKMLKEFVKDYGSFHMTYSSKNGFSDLVDDLCTMVFGK